MITKKTIMEFIELSMKNDNDLMFEISVDNASKEVIERMIEEYGNKCYIDGQSDALIETKVFNILVAGLTLQVGVKNNIPVAMSLKGYDDSNLTLSGVFITEQAKVSKKRIPLSPSIDMFGWKLRDACGVVEESTILSVGHDRLYLSDGSEANFVILMNAGWEYLPKDGIDNWMPCYQEIEE